MGIEHIENTGENNEFPFAYLPSKDTETNKEKIIGTGWESQVKRLGPDWVIKDVNPFNQRGEERSQEMLDHLRNPERVKEIMGIQDKFGEIFGEEHFARSYFVYGKDQNAKEGYILVQKFIPGKALSDMIGTEYKDTQEMIENNREQFKEIVWGLKKSLIEFGVPLDFHPGNLIKNEKTGNIVIMDTGIPSQEFRAITSDENSDRILNTFENAYRRLERMDRYEKFLNLTEEEKISLNKKYDITEEKYESSIRNLDEMKNEKGLNIEVVNPVDQLLNRIFGERQEIAGQEIYDYALKVLGKNEPTESQKNILEELKKQGTVLGDRSHWKSIIEL